MIFDLCTLSHLNLSLAILFGLSNRRSKGHRYAIKNLVNTLSIINEKRDPFAPSTGREAFAVKEAVFRKQKILESASCLDKRHFALGPRS